MEINFVDFADDIDFKLWKILTYSIYVEVHRLDKHGYSLDDPVEYELESLLADLNNSISRGYNEYPCEYLFLFRTTFLNEHIWVIDVRGSFSFITRIYIFIYVCVSEVLFSFLDGEMERAI